MKLLGKVFSLLLVTMGCGALAETNTIQTIDLKPFYGKSQFTRLNVEWTIPQGRQVAGGIPFQMGGIVELYGKSALQSGLDIRTNVNGMPINKVFEELHLLCCTTGGSPTGKASVVTIKLNYEDGSSKELPIIFGTQTRQWWGPRHEEDTPLIDSRSTPVWSMELSDAARSDKRSRFFHTPLTNPSPEKIVKSIDLQSTKTTAGVLIAGMSVGPAKAAPLPNTLPNLPPDPEKLERKGELATITGNALTIPGVAMPNALVRIIGAREIKSPDSGAQHPAIGRETRTDAKGHFQFTDLPDNWLYQLMALSDGLEPSNFYGVDPRRGAIEMRLGPAKKVQPTEKHFVHGKLLGPDGKPVVAATIEPYGVGMENGGKSWGGSQGFPDSVVTTLAGEFLFERKEPFTSLQLDIHANGLASTKLWLDATNTIQTVKLGEGAELTGRVLKDGKPLSKVRVGVCGSNRNSEVFAGHFEVRTDGDGRFSFKHLPAQTGWDLYGIIQSLQSYGALPSRSAFTPKDNDKTDLGDLEVVPGLTLAGKIQTVDGRPLPAKLQLYVGSERAWDSTTVKVDQNGNFELRGLYKGLITMYASLGGWQFAAPNRSLDDWNPWSLAGLLEKDKTDLLLVVEEKERDYNNSLRWNGNGQLPQADISRARPFCGAEASGSPYLIPFAGSVVDGETGNPIPEFQITQGRKPPFAGARPSPSTTKKFVDSIRGKAQQMPQQERPYWDYARIQAFKNGHFELGMMQLSSTPMLRVEAKGFVPFETEPMPSSNTNLVIRLSKGQGPMGTVLLTDGKPAKGATIIFARQRQQFSLGGDGKLYTYSNKEQLRETGAAGLFSFPPSLDGRQLFVSHSNGWANVRLSDFSNGNEIKLQPWAVVTGTLVRSNGTPVANERMVLTMNQRYEQDESSVNLQERPTTDAKGRFQFLYVPAEAMQLHRLVPSGPNSANYKLQTRFVVEAGKTNDLGKVTLDTPPPPSVFDEIKRKIGL